MYPYIYLVLSSIYVFLYLFFVQNYKSCVVLKLHPPLLTGTKTYQLYLHREDEETADLRSGEDLEPSGT